MANDPALNESPVRACIGLGGNLGDVATAIDHALAALGGLPGTLVVQRSRLYRTKAWGMTAQPDFLNAAVVLSTTLSAEALLAELLLIERKAGRDRGTQSERWGPRALDLDLLLYGDAVIANPGLCVPHPHLHERAFVLVPLAEIAPDALVPGRGRVDALLMAVDAQGIAPLAASPALEAFFAARSPTGRS
jgi:2-amino-4-hydroxy-6-hydroxymethyldihydropteridine diphosphokinase